jgi:hypothetical protein
MDSLNLPFVTAGVKVCSTCGLEKSVDNFAFEPRVKSKLTARCCDCRRSACQAYVRDNPEKIKEARQKYVRNNAHRWADERQRRNERAVEKRREKRLIAGQPPFEPRVTDDGRRCSDCRRRKPILEFPPDSSRADKLATYCRNCLNRRARKYRESPKTKSYRAKYMRGLSLKKYGLTFEAFDEILVSQDGKCAICCEELQVGTRKCVVDHNHTTGVVRGVLCNLCNVGIGHFRDSPDLLSRAISYLKR